MKAAPYIAVVALLISFLGCSTTQTLVKQETGTRSIEFSPSEASKEIKKGLVLKVKPMDASDLDLHTYFYSRLDGRFFFDYTETDIIRYYNTLETDDDYDEMIKARRNQSFGLLDKKVSSGLLPSNVSELIKYKIKAKDAIGKNGLQPSKNSMWSLAQSKNPYFQRGDYMGVFQLTVENLSGKNQSLELEKLLVQNGNEQLYPFSTDRLLEYEYSDDQKKNLHRINMPDKLVVPDDEKVIKFISTPPVNAKQEVSVQYIMGDDAIKYGFEMDVTVSKENIEFKRFEFSPKKGEFNTNRFYSVIVTQDDTTILKSNVFFYPNNRLHDTFSVFSILGVEGGFQYGSLVKARFSDFEKGKIEIPYEKPIEYIK